MHVRRANFDTRVDPLQWNLPGEEEQLIVSSLRVLLVNWSRAKCLHNGPLILNLLPGLLVGIDLVDLEIELPGRHRRATE